MELDESRRIAAVEDRHWWYVATRRLLAEQLQPWLAVGGRLLDAGGGTGATGSWLAGEGRLVACDLEPLALRLYAEAHPEVSGLALADLGRLPFPAGSFDAVVCVSVLFHPAFPSPPAVAGELAPCALSVGVV